MPDTSADTPVLRRHDADGIATLTLNRPDKYNALSEELLAALQAELDRLATDAETRVVILRADGKAFCAGHDLGEMREDCSQERIRALFDRCSHMMMSLTRIPQPVIARVQGIATAAGCQLVAQCDLAVAAEAARFATSGIKIGLFCSTPMVPVTRNLPRKQAMEMLLTGDFMDAPTARDFGLVNRVVPADRLDAEVEDLAARIARHSPASIALGKQLFYTQADVGLEEAYRLASETMTCNMMTEDAQAGVDAFVNKQPMPEWKGR